MDLGNLVADSSGMTNGPVITAGVNSLDIVELFGAGRVPRTIYALPVSGVPETDLALYVPDTNKIYVGGATRSATAAERNDMCNPQKRKAEICVTDTSLDFRTARMQQIPPGARRELSQVVPSVVQRMLGDNLPLVRNPINNTYFCAAGGAGSLDVTLRVMDGSYLFRFTGVSTRAVGPVLDLISQGLEAVRRSYPRY